jgi:hypothetical protein
MKGFGISMRRQKAEGRRQKEISINKNFICGYKAQSPKIIIPVTYVLVPILYKDELYS